MRSARLEKTRQRTSAVIAGYCVTTRSAPTGLASRRRKRRRFFSIEQFGQQEIGEHGIGKRQDHAGDEGQPDPVLAEDAAEKGTGDEADTERDAHQAEVLGTPFRRADVGDVGIGGGEGGAEHAADDACREQPQRVVAKVRIR